jgi:PhnB protein
MQTNPYLHFNGQCEAAFQFYAKTLDAKIEAILSHAGAPVETQVPPEWRDKVMHACMTVGSTVLMGCDTPPDWYQAPKGFSVSLAVEDPSDADRIFQALSENGTVQMPIQKTFWANRFGMLTDQFGIPWMINCAPGAAA